jgi:hypothetical protein
MAIEPTERCLNDVMQLGQVQRRWQEQLAPDRRRDVFEGDLGLDDGRVGIEHDAIMAVIRVGDNERRQATLRLARAELGPAPRQPRCAADSFRC